MGFAEEHGVQQRNTSFLVVWTIGRSMLCDSADVLGGFIYIYIFLPRGLYADGRKHAVGGVTAYAVTGLIYSGV